MIERENRGGVAVLRLRHGKANAMDVELLADLDRALEDAEHSARAAVITASGSIFSAGVDLKRLIDGGPPYLDAFLPLFGRAFARLLFFPRPIVAAVNGHAIAGGVVLACACDHRLLARGGAKLGVPELRVGVPFPSIALEILRFALPPPHFQEIVYFGRTVGSEDALRLGIVDGLVGEAELLDRACEAAADLASIAEPAFRLTKEATRRPARERLAAGAGRLDEAIAAAWKAPATLQAIRSYVEKTLK
jgi:enoyl-CoA hydratase